MIDDKEWAVEKRTRDGVWWRDLHTYDTKAEAESVARDKVRWGNARVYDDSRVVPAAESTARIDW